jgi:hypothetical protein
MKLRLLALGVELAEIEQELKGVVPDLKVVGVPPLKRASVLGVLAFMLH